MLFNRDDDHEKAIVEFKKYASFVYQSSNFANIELDIELAEEDIIKIVGNDLYLRAHTHYHSVNYEKDTPSPAEAFNDMLVHYLQLPIALYSSLAWSQGNDVSHTSEGRKITIDKEKESIAWDWMIDADNRLILNKAHKTFDRLVKFLEDNDSDLSEWKDSDAQKEARSLFINNAVDFNRGFPIDESRRFFIHLIPFIREVENKFIKPILETTLFDTIKAGIVADNLSAENTTILENFIKPAIRMLTMAKAIKFLAVQVLPNGVYQNYISDRLSLKTKKPADTDVRREVSSFMDIEGKENINQLEEHLRKLQTVVDGEDYEITAVEVRDYSDKKHVRV